MGTFRTTIQIGDAQGQRWETLDALVDTGSTFTWVPRDILVRLGIQAEFRQEFQTADGRVIEREIAQTRARLAGEERITIVVFGGEGDTVLLGAYTLEAFSLAPDPVNQRLVRVRGLAMAFTGLLRLSLLKSANPCYQAQK